METYPVYTYPDSGHSSPRSREIDFENTASWEDSSTLPANHKVKFMVSYNGKIQPRTHDNLLSYIGGETKILAVDRTVKFSYLYSKLAALASLAPDNNQSASDTSSVGLGFNFKYQLPGEDLDALISVTNDDDLEHMMSEYDRMWKASSKPARLRLFLFPRQQLSSSTSLPGSAFSSVSSEPGKLDRRSDQEDQVDRNRSDVVSDVLDVGSPSPPVSVPVPVQVQNNVDFLFGLDKGPVHNRIPGPVPVQLPVHNEPVPVPDLNRLQISGQEFHHFQLQQQQQQLQQQQQAAMFSSKNDENFADPYQKSSSPVNIPSNFPAPSQVPPGYWQQIEHQQSFPPQQPPQLQQYHPQQPQSQPLQPQQQFYMMHAPPQASAYNAPQMMRPNQGFYQVPPEPVYREQPVFSIPATVPAVSTAAQVRPVGEGAGYAPVAYDSATGRQIFYAPGPQGGVITPPPFPGMTAVTTSVSGSGDMRGSGDGKVVQKIVSSQATV